MKTIMVGQVNVGDMMRVSVPLLEHINQAEGQHSPKCRVVEIRIEDDGTKTLVLERAE